MTRLAAAGVAALLVVLTGCSASPAQPWASATPATDGVVAPLPVGRVGTVTAAHLADDVIPPTNRWYSSLAFAADPLPVYPYPIAFLPAAAGFAVQLPAVTASATTISAPFTGGLALSFGTSDYQVVRTDPVSVTLAYTGPDGPAARVTIAEGSPLVAVDAERDLDVALPARASEVTSGAWSLTVDGVIYLLVAPSASLAGDDLRVPQGTALQVAPLPPDGDPAAWAAAIGDPVTGVRVDDEVGGGDAQTRLTYEGADRSVLVPFAGHAAASDCDLGSYQTAFGPAPACAATRLEWSVPELTPVAQYDLAGLTAPERSALAGQAAADLAGTGALPSDTYFGGKQLARLAGLLALARSLDDEDLDAQAADRLATEIAPWVDADGCLDRASQCFVYDDALRTVVGKEASFGAEDGNDHHFHYGYFLFAAAVLATERPELVETLRPVMDALAADIAGGAGDTLPTLRVFDPYRGHSWASGTAPFTDGNNQESTSEAVAAWNGLALWADATGDASLRDTAVWLLSSEADAARTLWLEPDRLPDAYAHTMVSLTWSDKRDYATWFSSEPSAILGIQAVPLGPVALEYLGDDPGRVAANVADAGAGAFTGALGDYVQAYSALASPAAATAAASAFQTRSAFDDGWSPALALAWVAAVQERAH